MSSATVGLVAAVPQVYSYSFLIPYRHNWLICKSSIRNREVWGVAMWLENHSQVAVFWGVGCIARLIHEPDTGFP